MFLLYDLETTGLLTTFDQATEFACLICDADFTILDKKNFDIRLSRDSIPALEALAVTPQIPSRRQGMPEKDALKSIHTLLASMPYNGGYNTLRFDDELLRFSFYRHGLYPYQHQHPTVSQRFDILPLVALFYVIHPNLLNWPIIHGKISLKLDAINQLNQFRMGNAHMAMFDVEVSYDLMRLLAQADPKLFHYGLAYFNKKIDKKRFDTYKMMHNATTFAYLFDPKHGSSCHYIQAYQYKGEHPYYTGQTLWQHVEDPTRIIRKKWGEPPWVMPEHIIQYANYAFDKKSLSHHDPLDIAAPEIRSLHHEANLYTNPQWLTQLKNNASHLINRWRYEPENLTEIEKHSLNNYLDYLRYGEPELASDHLGRHKRHLQDIDKVKLSIASSETQNLYHAITEDLYI